MSVGSFDPKALPVSMTEAAVEYARSQLLKQGATGMRLGVKKSGCSGYMYTLDWVQAPTEDDIKYDVAEGVALYIAKSEVSLVKGTQIDFVKEGLNSTMKFQNPGATSMCGCGESFSL